MGRTRKEEEQKEGTIWVRPAVPALGLTCIGDKSIRDLTIQSWIVRFYPPPCAGQGLGMALNYIDNGNTGCPLASLPQAFQRFLQLS